MIKFEQKKINNKPFYYLSEQVNIGDKFKKIQVFVGKNIPKDASLFYTRLKEKEIELVTEQLKKNQFRSNHFRVYDIQKIELSRIDFKYHVAQLSMSAYERFLRDFAVRFTFESNAIEGSRLSQNEVKKIVLKQYVKKSTPRNEIQEVFNTIDAFTYICSGEFSLTQKSIKHLHSLVTKDLDIEQGFKKQAIIVNNKETTQPKLVRADLKKLITWYKETKLHEHTFVRATLFHNRFEHIHPFTDGNGRTGRLIFNWMLLQSGYGFILFKNSNRKAYMSALDKGDNGQYRNILKLSKNTYQGTIEEFTQTMV